ncbi:hypothetical protein F5884DRAFT_862631 [Xylogone sp. PMI_703]|nr:hypothetical protein F5884DRAFT_862631 [Xylogone sp. PMI_703]
MEVEGGLGGRPRRELRATSKVRENRENEELEDGEFFQNALNGTVKQGRGRPPKTIVVANTATPAPAITVGDATTPTTRKDKETQAMETVMETMKEIYKLNKALKLEIGELKGQLEEAKAQMSGISGQLVETREQLAETNNQLTETKTQLAETNHQITETKTQLAGTNNQLTETKMQLAETNTQLLEMSSNLSASVRGGTTPTTGLSTPSYSAALLRSVNPSSSASQPNNAGPRIVRAEPAHCIVDTTQVNEEDQPKIQPGFMRKVIEEGV